MSQVWRSWDRCVSSYDYHVIRDRHHLPLQMIYYNSTGQRRYSTVTVSVGRGRYDGVCETRHNNNLLFDRNEQKKNYYLPRSFCFTQYEVQLLVCQFAENILGVGLIAVLHSCKKNRYLVCKYISGTYYRAARYLGISV